MAEHVVYSGSPLAEYLQESACVEEVVPPHHHHHHPSKPPRREAPSAVLRWVRHKSRAIQRCRTGAASAGSDELSERLKYIICSSSPLITEGHTTHHSSHLAQSPPHAVTTTFTARNIIATLFVVVVASILLYCIRWTPLLTTVAILVAGAGLKLPYINVIPNLLFEGDSVLVQQGQLIPNVSNLLANIQTLDGQMSKILGVVKEAECLALGFTPSTPMPPISRLESSLFPMGSTSKQDLGSPLTCGRLRQSLMDVIVDTGKAYQKTTSELEAALSNIAPQFPEHVNSTHSSLEALRHVYDCSDERLASLQANFDNNLHESYSPSQTDSPDALKVGRTWRNQPKSQLLSREPTSREQRRATWQPSQRQLEFKDVGLRTLSLGESPFTRSKGSRHSLRLPLRDSADPGLLALRRLSVADPHDMKPSFNNAMSSGRVKIEKVHGGGSSNHDRSPSSNDDGSRSPSHFQSSSPPLSQTIHPLSLRNLNHELEILRVQRRRTLCCLLSLDFSCNSSVTLEVWQRINLSVKTLYKTLLQCSTSIELAMTNSFGPGSFHSKTNEEVVNSTEELRSFAPQSNPILETVRRREEFDVHVENLQQATLMLQDKLRVLRDLARRRNTTTADEEEVVTVHESTRLDLLSLFREWDSGRVILRQCDTTTSVTKLVTPPLPPPLPAVASAGAVEFEDTSAASSDVTTPTDDTFIDESSHFLKRHLLDDVDLMRTLNVSGIEQVFETTSVKENDRKQHVTASRAERIKMSRECRQGVANITKLVLPPPTTTMVAELKDVIEAMKKKRDNDNRSNLH